LSQGLSGSARWTVATPYWRARHDVPALRPCVRVERNGPSGRSAARAFRAGEGGLSAAPRRRLGGLDEPSLRRRRRAERPRERGARRGEAAALLTSALATARELGMDGLVAKVRRLGLDAAPTAGAQEPADGEAVFRNEGDVWTVIYAGTSVRLKHSKGLGDIAILLANRGRDIHVADLIAASAGAPPDPRSTPAADLVAQGLRVSRGASGDAVLDHRARADYRERLAGLHRELEDAERCNDEGRVARAR